MACSKVIDKMLLDPVLGKLLKKPSVSCGNQVLYAASGLFEVNLVWIVECLETEVCVCY
jgi:hypothetical protein